MPCQKVFMKVKGRWTASASANVSPTNLATRVLAVLSVIAWHASFIPAKKRPHQLAETIPKFNNGNSQQILLSYYVT
jgi:hypothetical protein